MHFCSVFRKVLAIFGKKITCFIRKNFLAKSYKMKHAFIITIGTRDIQIHKENRSKLLSFDESLVTDQNNDDPDYFYFKSPRQAGEKLLSLYNQLKAFLAFPMIDEFMDHLQHNLECDLRQFAGILVYTDQQDVANGASKGDTLYFKDILVKHLIEKYPLCEDQIKSIPVKNAVADIDTQYANFSSQLIQLFTDPNAIDEIFLFPQGGIDQINQAITLQLIQLFRNKVRYFQKPRKQPVRELQFPVLFLTDLHKNVLKDHLDQYGFDRVDRDICPDKWVYHLCTYAAYRLSLRYEDARSEFSKSISCINDKKLKKAINQLGLQQFKNNSVSENRQKLVDLYISIKIKSFQKNYRGFLIDLFTLSENFEKQYIDEYTNQETGSYYNKPIQFGEPNSKWESFISQNFPPEVLNNLKSLSIDVTNPNWQTYKFLFKFLINNQKLPQHLTQHYHTIDCFFDKMRGLRNRVAHSLSHPQFSQIQGDIKFCNITIDDFFKIMDGVLDVSNYGDFDLIKNKIYEYYKF